MDPVDALIPGPNGHPDEVEELDSDSEVSYTEEPNSPSAGNMSQPDETQPEEPSLKRRDTDPAAIPPSSPASLPSLKTVSDSRTTPSISPPRDVDERRRQSSINLRNALHETMAGFFEDLPYFLPSTPMDSSTTRGASRISGLVSAVQAEILSSPQDDDPSHRLHLILSKLETIKQKTRR